MSVYVGIDVHRKRSQVAVVTKDGQVQLNKNVVNGSEPFLRLIGDLPPGTPVAFEAAFGWGWLAELLEDYGFEAHLVHPLRCKAIASARLKNDKVDAAILAQLLRADLLPEAWIAPPAVRALRALLRHRIQLVRLRTLLGNRIHAVAADHGYDRSAGYWSGPGRAWLASLDLPPAFRQVIDDDLALIDALASPIAAMVEQVHQRAKRDPAVKVLTQLPGVGEFTALVILAETGDITRFGSARKLASWAGLTPTVRGPGPEGPARQYLQDGMCGRNGSAASTGGVRWRWLEDWICIGGQLTFDYVDTGTGESWRGRICPADRESLRGWLRRFDGVPDVEFAVEGCTGWRYVVEELQRAGITAHLAEPAETAGLRGRKRRAKTDWADARHLRDLLLDGRIPESWIPPAHVLEARALVRLYKDLLEERTSWQQRVHATLFHQGIPVVPKLGTADGQQRLEAAGLSAAGRLAVQAGLRQIERLNQEMVPLRRELARLSLRQPGCRALRKAHYGIGGLQHHDPCVLIPVADRQQPQ